MRPDYSLHVLFVDFPTLALDLPIELLMLA
jgi:hypothetical protein